jgi:hypothetical protein
MISHGMTVKINKFKLDDFSAEECFKMYRKLITDEDTFNKKVRKEK